MGLFYFIVSKGIKSSTRFPSSERICVKDVILLIDLKVFKGEKAWIVYVTKSYRDSYYHYHAASYQYAKFLIY